jgi:hypothetical protein
MHKRNTDPTFDREEIEQEDPLGEELFAEEGFEDAEDGGPALGAPGLEDPSYDKRPGRLAQKMAGVPEREQHAVNTPSEERPDSEGVVIRERGGQSKGDPAVGGTRPG